MVVAAAADGPVSVLRCPTGAELAQQPVLESSFVNSTPLWVPLVVAAIGLLGTIVGTVSGSISGPALIGYGGQQGKPADPESGASDHDHCALIEIGVHGRQVGQQESGVLVGRKGPVGA